ncbi:MFS general substrate transporter [Trametes versicolor FP-101664 SS1]|uniref:MFS general substrate transporter n=1 Tax=Trametes versicolor (strain FP-101664) TaxID=717944 RepID=UPI000462484E|nr:MFS general substrate transporter [Trametes versicolor FP-101664 SS1]EIW63445.1 MFS general substrate transporter [Trametes versicolor FP-101664 SS1]
MSTSQLEQSNREVGSAAASINKSEASATVRESSRPPTARPDDVGPPQAPSLGVPEGGLAAWLTVAGAFLCQMCGFGYTGSFGVYQDFYTRVYLSNQSSSAISWIGSLNAFLVISGGLIAGRLYDRGYFYHLLYGGSLLLAFSLFMLSLAKPNQYYQVLLSQGIGAGLGAGMVYIPSVAIISQYFHKRRALTMTIVASGSSLGSIVHPIMLNNTLNNPKIGFATAARANAGLISGLLLIACFMMRTRTTVQSKPADLWVSAKRFSKDLPYVFAALGMTVFATGFYFPLFYIQLDALTHGLDKTFAFYSLVIMNASSFVGRLSPGWFANRLGSHNIIVTATFCCAILIFGMIGISSVASVVVIAVIYGFFVGTYIAMLGPLLAHLTDDMSELGARMGIAFACAGIGSLVGTPISGALLTAEYHWWRPALFSGIVAFAGFGCFSVSIILLRRRKAHQRALDLSEKA